MGRRVKNDYASVLTQSSIFSHLSAAELAELSTLVVERHFETGESIFWEDEPPDWFYIIGRGQVKVSKLSSQGKETILSFFGPGEMFGEVAVFEDQAYPASAQATAATQLLGIRKSDFLAFLTKHPAVSLKIISILSGRLRIAQSRLRDLAGERVEQRLARLLQMLSARLGNELPFTRQELSDMAGTTTETTIRILSQWKERGIIGSSRGKIILADNMKLSLLAQGPPL
jgi:CRP/FNR family transcriptional regulator